MNEQQKDASALSLIKQFHEAAIALGLVAYAMVRVAYDSFYGALGVTIEEVGLTYSAIVARAAQGFVLFGAVLLGLILGARLLLSRAGKRRLTPTVSTTLRISAAIVIAFACLLMASAVRFGLAAFFVGAAIGACGALLAAWGVQDRERRIFAAVLAACFAAVATMSFANFWGELKGEVVRGGTPVHVQGLFGVLEQNAPLVCVRWMGDGPPQGMDVDSPLISLGASGGTTVLYRFSGDDPGALRLPTSAVALTQIGEGDECC